MVEKMGRKLMTGDVIELPHMREDLLLDEDAPAVNQYWVVQDASKAQEGFDPVGGHIFGVYVLNNYKIHKNTQIFLEQVKRQMI